MVDLGRGKTLLSLLLVVAIATTIANGAKPLKESNAPAVAPAAQAAPAPLGSRIVSCFKGTFASIETKLGFKSSSSSSTNSNSKGSNGPAAAPAEPFFARIKSKFTSFHGSSSGPAAAPMMERMKSKFKGNGESNGPAAAPLSDRAKAKFKDTSASLINKLGFRGKAPAAA